MHGYTNYSCFAVNIYSSLVLENIMVNIMKVSIKKQSRAMLISFHSKSKAFSSPSERNKFFFGLHGRRQTVRKGGVKYIYRRKGILDSVPHIKVDDSVFIVSRGNASKVLKFFEEWQDKVGVKTFTVLLGEREMKKICRECLRVRIE